MPRFQRIDAVLLVIVLVVAACGSTNPTRPPGPASARPTPAAPSAAPASPSAAPSSAAATPAAPADPFLGRRRDRLGQAPGALGAPGQRRFDQVRAAPAARDRADGPRRAGQRLGLRLVQGRAGLVRRSTAAPTTAGSRWPARTGRPGSPSPSRRSPGSSSRGRRRPRSRPIPADAKTAAASINAFGLDLYRRHARRPGRSSADKNAVFSPTSIALALAMARAGAKGETAAEMDAVLHTNGWDDLGPGLNALDQALASRNATWQDERGPTHELALRIANTAFAQRGWTIEQALPRRDRR